MNTYLIKTKPELTSVADLNRQDAMYFHELLLRLMHMGIDMAHIVARNVEDETSRHESAALKLPELVDAYVFLARCVRRTAGLGLKLTDPARKAGRNRVAVREQIIRRVEDALHRDGPAGPEIEEDILDRPMAEIMIEICRDFGLGSLAGIDSYKRRSPEDIARLSACLNSLDLKEWAPMLLREAPPG